jgi:phosphonate transport system permease protein
MALMASPLRCSKSHASRLATVHFTETVVEDGPGGMNHTIPMPPDTQLEPLLGAYARAVATRRRMILIGAVILAIATLLSGIGAEVQPLTFWDKLGNFTSYFDRLTHLDTGARVWTDPVYWYWGWKRWSLQLGQTLLIAYVGTATGSVLAIAGAVLASRNLIRSAGLRFVSIRLLEFSRTVPDIVFALIFVVAFGLGALPGVLAITLHTTGTLGKLFAEVIENIDMKPVEGVQGTGGSWLSQVRFGVLPQVLSNFASYALLRFEINVRGAAVIGFVGAGGIGQELIVAIRKFYYSDVSAILLMLLVCVMVIDWGSEKLRYRLLAAEAGA